MMTRLIQSTMLVAVMQAECIEDHPSPLTAEQLDGRALWQFSGLLDRRACEPIASVRTSSLGSILGGQGELEVSCKYQRLCVCRLCRLSECRSLQITGDPKIANCPNLQKLRVFCKRGVQVAIQKYTLSPLKLPCTQSHLQVSCFPAERARPILVRSSTCFKWDGPYQRHTTSFSPRNCFFSVSIGVSPNFHPERC